LLPTTTTNTVANNNINLTQNNQNSQNINNNNIVNSNNNNDNISYRNSVQLKTRNYGSIFHNSSDTYTINFNKICGLETFPKKIKIIESSKTEGNSEKEKKNREFFFAKNLIYKCLNMGYMTNQEILNEIEMLSNKHKLDDQMGEELVRIGKKIDNEADITRKVLKNKNPNQDIMFGKVEDKNIRFRKLN
jgi:hypothetical protein